MITQLVINNTQDVKNQAAPGESWPDGVAILERLDAVRTMGVTLENISVESGIALNALLQMANLSLVNEHGSKEREWFGKRDHYGQETRDTKLLRALSAWLDDFEAKREAERKTRISTPTRTIIESVAMRALREKRLVSLSGSYGIGKSTTLEWFTEDHPMTRATPGAAYVVFTKDDRGPAAAYRKIASAMGISGRLLSRDSAAAPVRNALRHGDVLLCDNVHYLLESGNINVLADIYDTTPASIVAAGNDVYAESMKKNSDDTDAFFSRSFPVVLEKSTEGDVDAVLLAWGLSGVAIRTLAVKLTVRTGKAGGLRALLKVLNHARERAALAGGPLDAKRFKKAATELMLELP
jgi:DNA transposition AAA+ family ATPase